MVFCIGTGAHIQPLSYTEKIPAGSALIIPATHTQPTQHRTTNTTKNQ